MGLAGLWLRRLAEERTATLGLAALVLATALAAALGPRLLEGLATGALRTEMAGATSFERNTVIYETARPSAAPLVEPSDAEEAGAGLQAAFPPDFERLVESSAYLVETSIWEVFEGTDVDSLLRLRVHEGALERLRIVVGRLPSDALSVVPDERPSAPPNQRAWVYEAVMPASALREMGAAVGDRLWLTVWLSDPLNLGQNVGAFVHIVGSYELADPDDDFWINDEALAGWRLNIIPGTDVTLIQSTALLAPESYRALVSNTKGVGLTLLYQWRFIVDAGRLEADRLGDTIAALRRLESAPPRSGMSDVPSDTAMSSGMLGLLLAHEARWRSAEAVLAVVSLGLLAIALATLAVVAVVSSTGRRRVGALLAARGASRAQVLRSAGLEAALLALPATVLAVVAAAVLVPQGSPLRTVVPAALVWAAATLILLAVVTLAGRSAVEPGRGRRPQTRPGPKRLLAETALVLGAFAGAWLLRERGVNVQSSATELGGADLLIAAVPALVGVAAGLVAMRLYPLPSRLLGAIFARRRDLLPVLAVRRIVRGGSSAAVLLLLVATATLGAFASATLAHLERAAELGAWQQVGAPQRIVSASLSLPADLNESQLSGVEASARASLRSVGTSRGTAWLLAVDLPAYAEVVAGTGAEPQPALPAALLGAPGEGPPPAIVSSSLGVGTGAALEVNPGRQVELRVAQVQASFPGVPAGAPFVVVAREQLGAALGGRPLAAGLLYLRAAATAVPELRAALAEVASGLRLDSQAEREAEIRDAPVMGAMRSLIGAGVVLAVAYAALAVGASLALAAAAQRDQLAHLRAMGLSRRGGTWLAFVEYGPAALLGYLTGVGLGIGLFAFLRPGLGLDALSGPVPDVPVSVEPLQLAGLLGAIVVILLVGWLIGALVQRDSESATAIRRGTE